MSHAHEDAKRVQKVLGTAVISMLGIVPCPGCITNGFLGALAAWVNTLIEAGLLKPELAESTAETMELIARHVRLGVRIEPPGAAPDAIPPRKH